MLRSPEPSVRSRPVERPERTDSSVFAASLLLLLLIVTLDVGNVLENGSAARYLLVLIPFIAILGLRLPRRSGLIRTPTRTDRLLIVLLVWGLTGTTYGLLFLGTTDTMRPVFIPMLIAPLYLWTLTVPSEDEAGRILRALAAIGVVYVVLNVVVNADVVPGLLSYKHFRNSDVLYVVIAVVAAIVLRRWFVTALLLLMAVFIFKTYPSLTSALVAMVTVLTLFVTRPRASRARFYVLGLLGLAAVTVALLNFTTVLRLSNSYFEAVGKSNANNIRLTLWKPAWERFTSSPVYGSSFTADATAPVLEGTGNRFQTIRLPYHNDYLLFLAEGGVLGTLLLLGWALGTELTLLRRFRGYGAGGQPNRAALVRVLLCGFNAFFVSAAFNPNLEGTATSATIFAVYGLAMLLGEPGHDVAPSDA